MSLAVSVFAFRENGEKYEIELEKGKDLAGCESARHKLYGSELAEKLGLKLLPQLKHRDLNDISGAQLDELNDELGLILDKAAQFSKVSGFAEEYLKQRVQNIIDAVQIAKEKRGVVIIW